MKEVPFKISAIGPKYSCHVVAAKAYTKLDRIFDIEDKTPIIASSICKRWEKTPTEKSVPEGFEFIKLKYDVKTFQKILPTSETNIP